MSERQIHFEMIDEEHARFIRRLSGAERLQIAWQMWDFARDLVQTNVRERHPDWGQDQVDREVARRMLGATT